MMKVSRKVGRSSHNSTSISRRKKKKSNEKNNLGKSGKRSRGHKRVKTYKRVKIFHKGGAPPKIVYDAYLEYKKISRVPFFNNDKTGKFSVTISVNQINDYVGGNTYTYRYSIVIKLKTGGETMTLEIPIEKYTGNLDDLKRTIKSSLFTSEHEQGETKYTFNFTSNRSFFDGIIEKSTQLLDKLIKEQKKIDEENKLIKRIKEIINKMHKMVHAYSLLFFLEEEIVVSYELITKTIRMMQASTEYEVFKTHQKILAENEKMLIDSSSLHDVLEKDTRKLLVDAVLNRILRTQSLLIITSHLFSEYNLHENEVMEVIELLQQQDPNYDLTHFPPSAIQREDFTNNPPYNLEYILNLIKERKQKIQVKEEQEKGKVKEMIDLMRNIHSRNKLELVYNIIGEERIGRNINDVWYREEWWSTGLPLVLFIDSWMPADQIRWRRYDGTLPGPRDEETGES